MAFSEWADRVQDAINVRRVFGEPYTHDGVMVIPVASVGGGAGGGSGDDPEHGGSGEGGGFGGGGRPVGAYVIQDGRVSWRPAVDVNRALTWVVTVVLVLLMAVSRVRRAQVRAS